MGWESICAMTALQLRAELAAGHLSAREILQAHLEAIEHWNPTVNAIVTLDVEGARRRRGGRPGADARRAAGLLHGLPVAHKDSFLTAGMRTTHGSPVFADFVPERSSLVVTRQQAAGAITLGKTNLPEFGAGSQTFNAVFGPTRNPYDPAMTAGGSSGGAAAALACRMVLLADGTDMGGSLRNPASFCNVVGLRPSPGRVPMWPTAAPYNTLSVAGPMARTVADAALMLAALAGPDARDPLTIDADPGLFLGRWNAISPARAWRTHRTGAACRSIRPSAACCRRNCRAGKSWVAGSTRHVRTSARRIRRSMPCAAWPLPSIKARPCGGIATASRTP